MKLQLIKITVLIIFVTLSGVQNLTAQDLASTGIGLRGVHWNVNQNSQQVSVHTSFYGSEVNVSGYGGTIFFFSRISKQMFLDFSLGAVESLNNSVDYRKGEDLDISSIVPILLGIRYMLLPAENISFIQPYLEAGVGAYLLNEVRVGDNRFASETVSVGTDTRPGGYLGGGLDLMLGSNFAFNFNARYHLVDFQNKKYDNGIEFGFGIKIMWGDYKYREE